MATITVKNIPNELYLKLKATASFNRRSINNEVIYCIENMIKSRKVNPDDFISQIENFYQNIDVPYLTDEKLKEYKEFGRL
ncbi:DNA-binding protein [candidate division KSB1 bacterium]|nr:DNA-binding protein [candidate division KSB1 bacterium]